MRARRQKPFERLV